jgi:hypothetical protein
MSLIILLYESNCHSFWLIAVLTREHSGWEQAAGLIKAVARALAGAQATGK